MTRLSASSAREELADALNRVAYGHERIILHRRSKNLAALVPMEDFKFLQELEDRLDLEAARKALGEKGGIPWEKLKKNLGI